jgi:hypothetical protein
VLLERRRRQGLGIDTDYVCLVVMNECPVFEFLTHTTTRTTSTTTNRTANTTVKTVKVVTNSSEINKSKTVLFK